MTYLDKIKKSQPINLMLGKVPPQAPELEIAVIGACMLERDTFRTVSAIICESECFYVEAHRVIWSAMLALHKNNFPVDLLTITEQLRKTQELEIVGGAYYITKMTMSVTSSAHVEAHARILVEKYIRRQLIAKSGEAIQAAYDDSEDVFDTIDATQKKLNLLTDGIGGDTATDVGETFAEILMEIAEMDGKENELVGVDTGYPEINKLIYGLQAGQLVLICARPSEGKTAFALNIAENSVKSKIKAAGQVLIISLETSKKPLVKRMVACASNVPLKAIQNAKLTLSERLTLNGLYSSFNKLPIKIIDDVFNISKIVALIRSSYKKYLKSENGKNGMPFFVVIDYLQLIEGVQKGNREQEVSQVSRSLKLLAKELQIPIVALAQLNRAVESRSDKKPNKSDLRESGALEQDADVMMFIWNQPNENKETYPDSDILKVKTWILIQKNKDGETGDVELKFAKNIQKWKNLEEFGDAPESFYSDPRAGITPHGYQNNTEKLSDINWEI